MAIEFISMLTTVKFISAFQLECSGSCWSVFELCCRRVKVAERQSPSSQPS